MHAGEEGDIDRSGPNCTCRVTDTSDESATFRLGGGHFCGRVTRLAGNAFCIFLPKPSVLKGYLGRKKHPPPWEHHRAPGTGLLWDPSGRQFLVSEVPLGFAIGHCASCFHIWRQGSIYDSRVGHRASGLDTRPQRLTPGFGFRPIASGSGIGLHVWTSGFGVQGLGFRVQGLGFRVRVEVAGGDGPSPP